MKVAQSYQTLFDPMDYTIHGILPARILEWVAVSFSRGSSQPRDQTGFLHCRWITGKPEKVKVSDLITGEKTATTNKPYPAVAKIYGKNQPSEKL